MSPAFGYGFSDIDGDVKGGSVDGMKSGINTGFGNAVEGINLFAMKTFWNRDWIDGCAVEEAYGVFYDFVEVWRCVDVLGTVK